MKMMMRTSPERCLNFIYNDGAYISEFYIRDTRASACRRRRTMVRNSRAGMTTMFPDPKVPEPLSDVDEASVQFGGEQSQREVVCRHVPVGFSLARERILPKGAGRKFRPRRPAPSQHHLYSCGRYKLSPIPGTARTKACDRRKIRSALSSR